jgi:shikimate kinase
MRIYLVGYMGSGKSTVSRKLAHQLGYLCFDLDDLFEQRFKITVADFFARYDESLFRRLESQLLKETAVLDNVVIATGGGTPCFYDNMVWMNMSGITIFLEMSVPAIISRLHNSKKKRPLLLDKTADELNDFVLEHLRHRNIFYSQARLIVPAVSINVMDLAKQIIDIQ